MHISRRLIDKLSMAISRSPGSQSKPGLQSPDTPHVSLAFLSCRRIALLELTIRSIVEYLQQVEPMVRYESVLVDNGSGPDIFEVIKSNNLDKAVVFKQNQGIARGLNVLFGLCEAPYILSLEDDWQTIPTTVPAIGAAIDVMQSDPKVCTVRLRTTNDRPYRRYGQWMTANKGAAYRHLLMDPETGWNVYANGGVMLRRSALISAGPVPEIDSKQCENAYSRLLGRSFVGAQLQESYRLLHHIGNMQQSPGWTDGR